MDISIKSQEKKDPHYFKISSKSLLIQEDYLVHKLPYLYYCPGHTIRTSQPIDSLPRKEQVIILKSIGEKIKELHELENRQKSLILEKIEPNITTTNKNIYTLFKEIQKDKIFDELINALRHEITNPISGIKLATDFYRSQLPIENNEKIELINQISKSVEKLTKIINPSQKFEKINVFETIKFILTDFKINYPKVNFQINVPENSIIKGHLQLFKQVITNLILNAIECPQKNNIQKIITITFTQNNYEFLIKFYDNGIPIENKTKLFSPYFTTKKGGSGLGLYICKKFCNSLDYQINYNDYNEKYFEIRGIL